MSSNLIGRTTEKMIARLKNYLFTGILVTGPVVLTFWIVFSLVKLFDQLVTPLIPIYLNPNTYLPRDIPGLGLIVLIIFLVFVGLGVTSNSFAKTAEGFTLLFPSIVTAITIVSCMYALSMVMKNIPMGITYASFAGLTIISTVVVGVIRFNQMPNLYSMIGLGLIIIGVLMVNLLGNN